MKFSFLKFSRVSLFVYLLTFLFLGATVAWAVTGDVDDDGVLNINDNCPFDANPSQVDADADNIGNACDFTDDRDVDADGVLNGSDNCSLLSNPSQVDGDSDGLGGACDPADGVSNDDQDDDDVLNVEDNCSLVSNPTQTDSDGDQLGNACDPTNNNDRDGDGVLNINDNCVFDSNAGQVDVDGDGLGDACDVLNDTFPHILEATVDSHTATLTMSEAVKDNDLNPLNFLFHMVIPGLGVAGEFATSIAVDGNIITLGTSTLVESDFEVTMDYSAGTNNKVMDFGDNLMVAINGVEVENLTANPFVLNETTPIPAKVRGNKATYYFSIEGEGSGEYIVDPCGGEDEDISVTNSAEDHEHQSLVLNNLKSGTTYECDLRLSSSGGDSNELHIGPFTAVRSSSGGGSAGSEGNVLIENAPLPANASLGATVVLAKINLSKMLRLGMSDAEVKTLQGFLNTHGFPLASSGNGSAGHETNYFGPRTKAALVLFQKANVPLSADGILGPKTTSVIMGK